MSIPGKANVDKSELTFNDFLANPEISREYLQAFVKLMAWSDAEETFKFVRVDSDGRILNSLQSATGDTLNNSSVSVTATPTLLASANADRKSVSIQNLGAQDVYIGGSASISTALGFILPVDGVFNLTTYTGAIYGVIPSSFNNVRVIEVT